MDRFRNSNEREKTCNEDQEKLMPYAFQRFLSYLLQENGVNGAILTDYEPEYELIENMDCYGNDLALTHQTVKPEDLKGACTQLCNNNQLCTAFTINKQTLICRLKTVCPLEERRVYKGVQSYVQLENRE